MNIEQEIITWLEMRSVTLNIQHVAGRKALLIAAGLDELQNAVNLEGATLVFCRNMLEYLAHYGQMSGGGDPVIALLETAKSLVGVNFQAECAALMQRWQAAPPSERLPLPPRRIRANGVMLAIALLGLLAVGYHFVMSSRPVQTNLETIQQNYGISPELFAEYVKKLALTEDTVERFFSLLKQGQVPREEWDAKLQEIAAQYKELLQRLEVAQSEDPQVAALKTQARQAIENGKFDDAEKFLNDAEARDIAAFEELEDIAKKRRISAAATNADNARLQDIQFRYAKAAAYWQQAAQLLPEEGQQQRGLYLNYAGYDLYRISRYADALPLFEQSLKLSREIGHKAGEGTTLNNIGAIYHAQGDYATASRYYEQSLAIRREIGDKTGEGVTLNNIGRIYSAQGDNATALQYYEQSLAISYEIGDKAVEGMTISNISQIYHAQGDYATALQYYEQSLAIHREIGNKAVEGVTCWNIGVIYAEQGDLAKAEEYIRRSAQIAEETGHPDLEMRRSALEEIQAKRRQTAQP